MASATHSRNKNSANPGMLSKIWIIDRETAEKTLGINSQKVSRSKTPSSSRNSPTNDRTLRRNRIDELFNVGMLFSAKNSKKSSMKELAVKSLSRISFFMLHR